MSDGLCCTSGLPRARLNKLRPVPDALCATSDSPHGLLTGQLRSSIDEQIKDSYRNRPAFHGLFLPLQPAEKGEDFVAEALLKLSFLRCCSAAVHSTKKSRAKPGLLTVLGERQMKEGHSPRYRSNCRQEKFSWYGPPEVFNALMRKECGGGIQAP